MMSSNSNSTHEDRYGDRDDDDDYNRNAEKRDTKDYDRDDVNIKSEYGEIVKAIVTNTSAVMQVILVKGLENFNFGFNSFKKKFEKKTEDDSTLYEDHDDDEREDLLGNRSNNGSSSLKTSNSDDHFSYHSRYNGNKSKKFTIN